MTELGKSSPDDQLYKCMLSWGTKFLGEGGERMCIPLYCFSTEQLSLSPPSTQRLVWREPGHESLVEAVPRYICSLCWYLFPFSRDLAASSYVCVFSLLGNTLCSSCSSRLRSFLSSSPIPLWETLHSTWPSFQSGATFTDVSSLIVLYLEWDRACPKIVTTKPSPCLQALVASLGCLEESLIFLVLQSLGLGLKLVEEGIFMCTLSSPSLQDLLFCKNLLQSCTRDVACLKYIHPSSTSLPFKAAQFEHCSCNWWVPQP